eukprot:117391_1
MKNLMKTNISLKDIKHIPYLRKANTLEYITQDYEKAEIFAEKFCHRGQKCNYQIPKNILATRYALYDMDSYPKNDINKAEHIKNPKLHKQYQQRGNIELLQPIQIEELEMVWKLTKRNVQYGPGIDKKSLESIFNEIKIYILSYFNIWMELEHIPIIHKNGHTIPTSKNRGDDSIIKNYRELTLT